MKNIGVLESLPVSLSMRRSATNNFGGALDMWTDVPRWDGGGTSREAAHPCRKDWRGNGDHGYDERRAYRQARIMRGKETYIMETLGFEWI